jgi:WD40 repeat protein
VHCYILCGSDPISKLINLDETTIATGDDEGCIKVWDTRQRSCCNSFGAHRDYISDITSYSDGSKVKLLATRYLRRSLFYHLLISMPLVCKTLNYHFLFSSGDGTLSVCDLRKNKVSSFTIMHLLNLFANC